MHAVDAGIFQAWLASTDDGIVAVDAEGMVVLHNPAASRVTGLAPAAALHRPWREVLQLDPSVAELLWAARGSGRTASVLANVLCAQGNLRTAETFAHPWTDAAGRSGILILIRDLTVLCRSRSGPGGREGYGSLVGADPAMVAIFDLIEAVAPSDAADRHRGRARRGQGADRPGDPRAEPALGAARSSRSIAPRSRPRCWRPSCSAASVPGRTAPRAIGHAELAHSGTLLPEAGGRGVDPGPEPYPPAAGQRAWWSARARGPRGGSMCESSPPRPAPWSSTCARAGSATTCYAGSRWSGSECPRSASGGATSAGWPNISWLDSPAGDGPCHPRPWPCSRRPTGREMSPSSSGRCARSRRRSRLWETTVIEPRHFPQSLMAGESGAPKSSTQSVLEDRRTVLLRALSSHGGNRTAAARSLGIGRATFYRWWRETGLGGPKTKVPVE